MTYAQKLEQKGMQQGMQQGMLLGEERGMQQGMRARALEIAEKMLMLYLDPDTVQKTTGLLKEEVVQIQHRLGL